MSADMASEEAGVLSITYFDPIRAFSILNLPLPRIMPRISRPLPEGVLTISSEMDEVFMMDEVWFYVFLIPRYGLYLFQKGQPVFDSHDISLEYLAVMDEIVYGEGIVSYECRPFKAVAAIDCGVEAFYCCKFSASLELDDADPVRKSSRLP